MECLVLVGNVRTLGGRGRESLFFFLEICRYYKGPKMGRLYVILVLIWKKLHIIIKRL